MSILKSAQAGTALTEYVLPSALVLTVSLGAWGAVSSGFEKQLKNVFASQTPASYTASQSNTPASATVSANTPQTTESTALSPEVVSPTSSTQTTASPLDSYQFCGSTSGKCITYNHAQLVETTGTIGTTQQIIEGNVTTLNQLVTLMKAENVDQNLQDYVTWLANAGHEMGGQAAMIEKALEGYQPGTEFKGNMGPTIESWLNQFTNTTPTVSIVNGQSKWSQPSIANFYVTYQNLLNKLERTPQSKADLDRIPGALDLINQATHNIYNVTTQLTYQKTPGGYIFNVDPTAATDHKNSNVICAQGGSPDCMKSGA